MNNYAPLAITQARLFCLFASPFGFNSKNLSQSEQLHVHMPIYVHCVPMIHAISLLAVSTLSHRGKTNCCLRRVSLDALKIFSDKAAIKTGGKCVLFIAFHWIMCSFDDKADYFDVSVQYFWKNRASADIKIVIRGDVCKNCFLSEYDCGLRNEKGWKRFLRLTERVFNSCDSTEKCI